MNTEPWPDIPENGWEHYTGTSKTGLKVTHVTPVNDIRPHTYSADCWCEPEINKLDHIVIHNSADQREAYEYGFRMRH